MRTKVGYVLDEAVRDDLAALAFVLGCHKSAIVAAGVAATIEGLTADQRAAFETARAARAAAA